MGLRKETDEESVVEQKYSHETVTERYLVWAQLPAETYSQIQVRDRAWNQYVDARDGLPEGTTAKRQLARTQSQIPLFN